MSLLAPIASPFDLVHVALDLDTTGLDSSRDTIIEVGAVKFQGDRQIDSFQSFVNPGRPIPDHIQRLTHISPHQVERAPMFGSIADDLAAFIGDHPVIGHNVSFDVGFLASHGLPLDNSAYDTWDLASVFLPRSMQYSLSQLTSFLGVNHSDPHRALSDAKATWGVFLQLLRRAAELDRGLMGYITGLAVRSRWAIAPLLQGLEATADVGAASSGLTGLDMENLAVRLGRPEQRRPDHNLSSLTQQNVAQFLGPKGYFSQTFSGFEHRPEQEEMLAAVTDAIYGGHHLVVEGGTGVGKSMAYLLPAVLFALSQGRRVVISTNTINLQEQLLRKDIPAMVEVISDLANTQAQRQSRRAVRALRSYNQQLAAMRLRARGVSPVVLRPLNIDVVDVSTPSGRSALLLGMLSYFFVFALLTGGMNLAIDSTAGERERGSLEPLLCLPVTRDQLIFGKRFAACLFMAVSLGLSLVAFYVMLKFVPLEKLGMTPNFGPGVVAKAFLLFVPFTLLGASLMTLVASFTKSFKEAQTWLSVVLLAPTLPILIVSILMVRPSTELMLIPSLSQHLLLVGLIKNEPVNMLHVLVSVSGTLIIGGMVTLICARLYRREGLLG